MKGKPMKFENGMILDGTKVIYQPTAKVLDYRIRIRQNNLGMTEICHVLILANCNVFVFETGKIVEREDFDMTNPWFYPIKALTPSD